MLLPAAGLRLCLLLGMLAGLLCGLPPWELLPFPSPISPSALCLVLEGFLMLLGPREWELLL